VILSVIANRPGPLLVANQSDRLGSRLCAIVNAWSLAKVLAVKFGFVWPRNECLELHHPLEIFSQDFLDEFEIPEADFPREINRPSLGVMTLEETRIFCSHHLDAAIIVPINFEIQSFAGEGFESAHERFLRSFSEIGWSPLIRQIISEKKRHVYNALHVRAGDIVTGDWSQSMPVEKYLPTSFVEYFIETLDDQSGLPLVIFSDNKDYTSHLAGRYKRVWTVENLVPDYQNFSEAQQAFIDAYMLSGASHLFGPVRSSFSQLASSIAGMKVQSVYESMGSADVFQIMESHLNDALTRDQQPPLQKLLARDICWMLDVFMERLTLDARLAWARQAVSCDPTFCIAKTRLAFALLQLGFVDAAELEAERARKIAETVSLYHDSLADSLACLICVSMFKFIASGPGVLPLDGIHQLQKAETLLGLWEQLHPAMIYRDDLLLNLRFVVQSMRWLDTEHEMSREHFVQRFKQECRTPSEILKWRRDGFTTLHTLASAFPGLLRHVEEISLRISSAIGGSLSNAPRRKLGRPLRWGFEQVYVSQSGLGWALGWAYPWQRTGDLSIGLIRKGMAIQGGILSGRQVHRFAIPLARGESHPLAIVVSGDGGWRQRLHDFLYRVGSVSKCLFRTLRWS
jgi:hypothetical protein